MTIAEARKLVDDYESKYVDLFCGIKVKTDDKKDLDNFFRNWPE
jgi:hypothetical protein